MRKFRLREAISPSSTTFLAVKRAISSDALANSLPSSSKIVNSLAYIALSSPEAVAEFSQKMDGHSFVDEKGQNAICIPLVFTTRSFAVLSCRICPQSSDRHLEFESRHS